LILKGDILIDFSRSVASHLDAIKALEAISGSIDQVAEVMLNCSKTGGVIYWLGNGGSAADAQHYAAELMVRYTRNREPIPSIALTTDTSLLTAHSNDYEYSTVFSRQVKALVRKNDVVVGISTSGNSENVLLAMQEAKYKGAITVGLLGRDGGRISNIVDYSLVVNNNITAHIQECHLVIGHYLCDYIEVGFSGSSND
jgi:D-sedoheptulose 7-phosphate isomerase